MDNARHVRGHSVKPTDLKRAVVGEQKAEGSWHARGSEMMLWPRGRALPYSRVEATDSLGLP